MAEYIEREALLEDISESVVFTSRANRPSLELRGANKIIDRIKSAPTADVVEVVRCKDCKYTDAIISSITGDKKLFCEYGDESIYVKDTHFCSYGHRKEGADNA